MKQVLCFAYFNSHFTIFVNRFFPGKRKIVLGLLIALLGLLAVALAGLHGALNVHHPVFYADNDPWNG